MDEQIDAKEQTDKAEQNLRYRTEHSEIVEHARFYGNMRYFILAGFGALTGGILSKVDLAIPPDGGASLLNLLLKFAGATAAGMCLVAEASAVMVWAHLAKRASDLEKILGYQFYRALPEVAKLPIPKLGEDTKRIYSKLKLYVWMTLGLKYPTSLVFFGLYLICLLGWLSTFVYELKLLVN